MQNMQNTPSPRMLRNIQRAQGLAGWAGLLLGLWLMGSLAWTNFAGGSTVGGVALLVLALPVALSSMKIAMSLSHYPIAAVLTVMQLLKRG